MVRQSPVKGKRFCIRVSPELFPISKPSTHPTAGSVPVSVLEAGEEELGPPLHSTLADQILVLPGVIVPALGRPGCLTGLCAGIGGGGEECWWWDLAASWLLHQPLVQSSQS